MRPDRFELPTFWFVARRSIQLSYGRATPDTTNLAGLTTDRKSIDLPSAGAGFTPTPGRPTFQALLNRHGDEVGSFVANRDEYRDSVAGLGADGNHHVQLI